jgi:hypothetical protein
MSFGWASAAEPVGNTADLILRRAAAASLVHGAADNASPVANIVTIGESSRGGTDTNVAGASGTVRSGNGTGTGGSGSLFFDTAPAASTGTTANTYAHSLTINSAGQTFSGILGSAASPSVGIGASNNGFFNRSTSVSISVGGTHIFDMTPSLVSINSAGTLGYTNGAPTGGQDTSLPRASAGVFRVANGSTGAGSLIVGTSAGAIGTSGAGVIALAVSTAPSTSPADTVQMYEADWNGAGTGTLFLRNEEGTIYKFGSTLVSPQIQINGGATITKVLTNTATLDFGNTLAQTDSDLTVTVTGAVDGDVCMVGAPNGSTQTGSIYSCWISATNTATVRFSVYGLTAKDPASGTFRVTVIQH